MTTARWTPRAISIAGMVASATVAGIAGATLVAPLALAVPERAVWPLAIGFGTLLAALAAAWAANLLDPARARSRLPAIVGLAEGTAVAVIVVGFVLPWLVGISDLFTLIASVTGALGFGETALLAIVVLMAAIGIVASLMTARLRSPSRSLRRDLALSLGLLALGVLVVVGGVTVTCSLTSCVA
uniref:Uncharacterized protein n=1 Tax=Thermorudis peleae TaxID=1382356 RepID=A0A831X6C0_9BACT